MIEKYILPVFLGSLPLLVGFVWRLSAQLSRLNTLVENISTNELPHLEGAIRDLHSAFIRHLERGLSHGNPHSST